MNRLSVRQVCGGSHVLRQDGARLRSEIERLWSDGEAIEIDFENIRIASVSFFDEGIGVLALRYPLEEIKRRLGIVNIENPDRRLLNDILRSRAKEHEARAQAETGE